MTKIAKDNFSNWSTFFTKEEHNFIQHLVSSISNNAFKFEHWYSLNDDVKAIVLNKSGKDDSVKEFHQKFTDFHLTVSGQDTVFIGDSDFVEINNQLAENDYCLVQSETIQEIEIGCNEILKLETDIIHCNVLAKDSIKLVIKKRNG